MIAENAAVVLGLFLLIGSIGTALTEPGGALQAIVLAIAGAALLLVGSLLMSVRWVVMTARWAVGELRRSPSGSEKGPA